ncbi:hypothetical protein TNCT_408761 [Trichonephila clavata]|nr:hypothetical protein TNCT_408761 [Trichonephila clavata]
MIATSKERWKTPERLGHNISFVIGQTISCCYFLSLVSLVWIPCQVLPQENKRITRVSTDISFGLEVVDGWGLRGKGQLF